MAGVRNPMSIPTASISTTPVRVTPRGSPLSG